MRKPAGSSAATTARAGRFESATLLHKKNEHLPIITALAEGDDTERTLELGIDEMVSVTINGKPAA